MATTGLRRCEVCALRLTDITVDGLVVRETKFQKSRLVPLHRSTVDALDRYLTIRRRCGAASEHLFVLSTGRTINPDIVPGMFVKLARKVGLRGDPGESGPRLLDLRHYSGIRIIPSRLRVYSGSLVVGFGPRPGAKAPDEPPSPTGYAPPPRLYSRPASGDGPAGGRAPAPPATDPGTERCAVQKPARERGRGLVGTGADRMPGRAANTGGAAGWGTARRLDCQRAAVGTGGCRGHRRRAGGRRTSALLRRVAGVRNVRQRKRAAWASAEAPWNTWVRTRSAPRIWIVTRFRPAHPVSGGMGRTPARPHHARVVRRRPSSAAGLRHGGRDDGTRGGDLQGSPPDAPQLPGPRGKTLRREGKSAHGVHERKRG